WPHLLDGLWNTAVLMISVSTLVLLVSLAISWIVVRSKARGRFLLDAVAFLPHAVPGIIFALSAAYVALFFAARLCADLRDGFSDHGCLYSRADELRDAHAEQRAGANPPGAGRGRTGHRHIAAPENGDHPDSASPAGAR